jgi:hypothetical protein
VVVRLECTHVDEHEIFKVVMLKLSAYVIKSLMFVFFDAVSFHSFIFEVAILVFVLVGLRVNCHNI